MPGVSKDLPDWMYDCIEAFEEHHGRFPTMGEILLWKEAVVS